MWRSLYFGFEHQNCPNKSRDNDVMNGCNEQAIQFLTWKLQAAFLHENNQ